VKLHAGGITLVELLVVLVLLGIAASVVGLAFGSSQRQAMATTVRDELNAARDSAIRSGHPLTLQTRGLNSDHWMTALPDGRIIADSALAIDRFSGDDDAAR